MSPHIRRIIYVISYELIAVLIVTLALAVLGFSGGALRLDVLRPAGKGDMSGRDWARGARLAADVCWRCTR